MSERFLLDPAAVSIRSDDDWPAVLGLNGRPLHVEIGFGKDVRILRAASRAPEATFLGIEISGKKAASFCRKVARLGLENVRAYCGDVRDVLMEKLPESSVASFTILFPDPWPKRRHNKHRWIQPETARRLARTMASGATLVVATDHDGYAAQIHRCLEAGGLTLDVDRVGVPDEDHTLFAARFERLGQRVLYQRWTKR
ncbi:MAG: tRNA (guanine(46)-N(7))-methyltransferase TrmB [Planctomycetota bacterium]|jgi:tRNA (guanine-N7-)-methyltransferase